MNFWCIGDAFDGRSLITKSFVLKMFFCLALVVFVFCVTGALIESNAVLPD